MPSELCLTAEVVEGIQQLLAADRPVDNVLGRVSCATLTGVSEYGCLRFAHPFLPALPRRIIESPIGVSLSLVRSKIGLRSDGPAFEPPRSMAPREYEFFVLEGTDPQASEHWETFVLRFRQSCMNSGFSISKATLLSAAFIEMADNAVCHSESLDGILAGYHTSNARAVFCVADAGIGILASLKSCQEHADLSSHADAIRRALRSGISRFGRGHGGLGFNQVFKALVAENGTLRFRSGEACISMDGRDLDADNGTASYVLGRKGFQVSVGCRLNNAPDSTPLI
jgi:hypothetical protein